MRNIKIKFFSYHLILIKTLIPLIICQPPGGLRAMEQKNYYPSGNKDDAKIYSSDRPSKKYPLLKLDIAAYDSEFNKIEPGIYSVEYSPEFNALLISDRQKIIKAPVFQVIKSNQHIHIPAVNIDFIKDDKIFIIYKNEDIEAQSFLYLP